MRLKTIIAIICFVFIANCVYGQYTSTRRQARRSSSSVSSKKQSTQRQTSRTNRSKNSTYNKRTAPTRSSVKARVKTNSMRSTTTRERLKPNYNFKKPMTTYKASTGKTYNKTTSKPKSSNTTTKRYVGRVQEARNRVSQYNSIYKPIKAKIPKTRKNRYRIVRDTYQQRKLSRDSFSIIDFSKHNPVTTYSDYNMLDAAMFGNMMFGLYFHDYYDHSVKHSYLWHYHHQDYDISHWSDEQIQLYHHFMNYYKEQGIEPDARYVDPGTNPDENYISEFVDANAEDFYGDDVETITVESLPDEDLLAKEFKKHIKPKPPPPAKEKVRGPPHPGVFFFGFVLLVGIMMGVGVLVLWVKLGGLPSEFWVALFIFVSCWLFAILLTWFSV